MTPSDIIAGLERAIVESQRQDSPLGEFIGMGIQLAKNAFLDHGEEGGRAHLAALLELEVQAAARARWG